MTFYFIYAFLSSFFFGVLFNVRKENLIYAGVGGALGWFVFEFLQYVGTSQQLAIFVAALVFGTYSEVMARVRKTTVTTFAITSLIPLVPGNGMYLTMFYVVKEELDTAVHTGLETLQTVMLLALGILFASTFAKLVKHTRVKK